MGLFSGLGSLLGRQPEQVDMNNWSDLSTQNFMDYGLDPGVNPSLFQQAQTGFGKLGESFAKNQGMLNFGLSSTKGLFDVYNTFQGNKLREQAMNFQKQQYATNLANSRQMTNMELTDRQQRRVSANPNAESVESYMKKWGV